MKNTVRFAMLLSMLALTGCKKSPELITCQNEKQTLQEELVQARRTIGQQTDELTSMKHKYEEVNQKALEITRMLMEKSVQFQNESADKEKQIQELKKQLLDLRTKADAAGSAPTNP